jgi:HEPN domain-containing protein
MTPRTREWVDKAEGDYDVVSILLRSRKPSRYDPICFHAQQCAEKYLKARPTDAGIAYPKTHDLSVVPRLALPVEPLWATLTQPLIDLTDWAVLPRYPGTTAGPADARQAVKTCRRFREAARLALGL